MTVPRVPRVQRPAPAVQAGRSGPPAVRVIACVFFFAPLLLCIIGYTSPPIENRPLSPAPHWRASWSVLDEAGRYVTDRLPFRQHAVELNAQVSEDLFNEAPATGQEGNSALGGVIGPVPTPSAAPRATTAPKEKGFITLPPPAADENTGTGNSQVLVGRDGWLYFAAELVKECNPGQSAATVVAGLRRLDQILTASGRSFAFTLAPDKTTSAPQHLPASYPRKTCSQNSKTKNYGLLDGAHIPGYIDMHGLIDQHQRAEKRDYYMRQDTHWNGLSDAVLSRQVASRLDPHLLDAFTVRERVESYTGDLSRLLGTPKTDKRIATDILRAGVHVGRSATTTLGSGIKAQHVSSTSSGGAKLVPGHTLLIGDSFLEAASPQLYPLFADLLRVRNGDFAVAPKTMLQQVVSANTVVLVFNERYFTDRHYGVLWSTPFLDKLQAALAH